MLIVKKLWHEPWFRRFHPYGSTCGNVALGTTRCPFRLPRPLRPVGGRVGGHHLQRVTNSRRHHWGPFRNNDAGRLTASCKPEFPSGVTALEPEERSTMPVPPVCSWWTLLIGVSVSTALLHHARGMFSLEAELWVDMFYLHAFRDVIILSSSLSAF